jgi:tetratricopeptide (TPR) repeat protein
MRRIGAILLLIVISPLTLAASASDNKSQAPTQQQVDGAIDQLDEPLYSPFIERYMLDEVRQLRIDMERKHRELAEQIVDRELSAADKALSYSNTTVTYFFYLIAAVSSALVLIGWNSLREVKEKVQNIAHEQVAELIEKYEDRLRKVESQLQQETELIEVNRTQISLTQEVHSLWLKASQESSIAGKIAIYDQIIALRPADVEAFTFKADAVLEQGEAQWAINLCHQALAREESNAHAFYQLACAHSSLGQIDEGARYFAKAVEQSEAYREELDRDEALAGLKDSKLLQELLDAAIVEQI